MMSTFKVNKNVDNRIFLLFSYDLCSLLPTLNRDYFYGNKKMNDSEYKQKIELLIKNHPKIFKRLIKNDNDLLSWIYDKTKFTKLETDLTTRLYFIINDITNIPICQNEKCSNKLYDKKSRNIHHFPKYCSKQCSASSDESLEKIHKTNLKRYGVQCTFQTEKSWDAIHKSCKEKYGNENIWSTDFGKQRIKETKKEKYGI